MVADQMKGITCCGDCGYYNWKKRKCNRCESIETDPRKHFYDDCPLPDVVEIIRCKDCQHQDDLRYEVGGKFVCRKGHGWNTDSFFCADGEPRKPKDGDGDG